MEKKSAISALSPQRVDFECTNCGETMMKSGHVLDPSNREYTCPKCGKKEVSDKNYPYIQWFDFKNHEWI